MSATPATREPTTLAGLATAIQSEHDAATTAARTAIEHAIRCGELLTEAKAQVPHGGWAGWLAEHFPASDRTARGYMRLAAHADELADRQALADLGIEGALRELAAPREDADRANAAACPRPVHWALDRVPPMTAAERHGLRKSIREHGCLVPIELDDDGQVLDGRERLAVCAELGIDPPTITRRGLSDEEKAGQALALNLSRGDYSPSCESISAAPDPAGEVDREREARRVQHVDVEDDLRRLFVSGEWRRPENADWAPNAVIAWALLGSMLLQLDQAGAPVDFGYHDLDDYVPERLPDVENAWLGLEFEMRAAFAGGAA